MVSKDEYLSNMFEEQDKSEKRKAAACIRTIILIAGTGLSLQSLLINAIQ